MKNNKPREKMGTAANYFFILKFILKNSPLLIFLKLLLDTATKLPWMLVNVVLLKFVLDTVQTGGEIKNIFIALAAFAVFVIIVNAMNTLFYEILLPVQEQKLQRKLYDKIYDKAARMDLSAYDDPKFYNDFVLSMNTMYDCVHNLIEQTTQLVSTLLVICTLGGIISSIDPFCFLFIALSVVMMVPLGRIIARVNVKRTEAMTPLDRKNLYFWRVFYLKDYAKELRLNPAGEMTERRYRDNLKDRIFTITPFLNKQWILYFCNESIPLTIMIYLGVALLLGYKVLVTKELSMGDFTASFNGALNIGERMFWIISFFAIRFRENNTYIDKYKKFMSAPETIKDGNEEKCFEKPQTITLRNVSFTYEGNAEPTLKNINLEIKPYQKIALVGYNGAGKTTLTNLLLRLYDVSEGEILIDGKNIKDWNKKAYHKNFAAVFQDFSLFGATVGENVAMNITHDRERVLSALDESGFSKKLSKSTDTVLLREFDDNGLSLSGGETQKVAIARAFYKKCPYAILDEPSANLDPVSEYALNDAMTRAAENKTVIFISHRLSTTVMADVIYMLENGEIIESGTHEELMAKNGKYAYMFRLQAEKYKTAGID